MLFEQLSSVLYLIVNLVGLMICLFQYIKRPTKAGICALAFLLSNLLSNYYWGIYVIVMNDCPNVSSLFSYVGWNLAFLVLTVMLILLLKEDKVRFFTPLVLIPIPLNIIQLFIYLQYGGYFNNIWQVFFSTAVICISINNIVRYVFKKKSNPSLRKPYIEIVISMFILTEYISWTSSCYTFPSEWLNPYNYASILSVFSYILLPFAIAKTYDIKGRNESSDYIHKLFKPIYSVFLFITCIGGYFLAVWMRDTLTAGISQSGEVDPFSVIAVMLFVVSITIILITIAVILVVSSEQKSIVSRKLEEAKSYAEKSNAAKSEFLANMSHEIRTPINAVLGMNEMILRESLEARDMLPEAREEIIKIFSDICNYSGNIESAGNNLLSIINDILDFSKIEAGKMEIVENEYKLGSVLNDVSNMISFKAKSKGIEFTVDVDENLPDGLYGDEVRVRQIITNLLNNAVKYTPKGSVCLSVKEKKGELEKTTYLLVKVKDTGIGIKKEDIPKLFNKFERVDLGNNSTIEGTGLGLAITGSLLKMMGGEIEVQSEYGKGSVFSVKIPQIVVSEEPIGNFKEKFEKSISDLKVSKEKFHAPDAHILIVDDTAMNLTVAKGLLKNTCINIDTASSGEESIELTKDRKYDLILMDQRMPNMDGVTAMKHIKEDKESINTSTPVICLTADAVSGARERYLSEGFEGYLSKPIDGRGLLDALVEYLPKNKIQYVEISEKAEVKSTPEVIVESLDREKALHYCNNDEEFYNTLLEEYVKESKEKSASIEDCYAKKDWKNYSVYVHSLKSTSKMIGAMKLSEIAAGLEKASDEGNIEKVEADHESMFSMYKSLVEEISKTMDIKTEEKNDSKDDEIMEFFPE